MFEWNSNMDEAPIPAITPEMIEAGIEAHFRWENSDEYSERSHVVWIFEAMCRAMPTPSP